MADNMVTLVGSLGNEPELRTTPSGADVVNFNIATNERVRGSDGKWTDGATSWFRITAWGALGANAHASLRKGQRVVVHGVLRITEFTTERGTSRSAEVKALAVGPDLAFGTATFTRNSAQGSSSQHAPHSAPPVAASSEQREPVAAGGGWAAPMSGGDDAVPF